MYIYIHTHVPSVYLTYVYCNTYTYICGGYYRDFCTYVRIYTMIICSLYVYVCMIIVYSHMYIHVHINLRLFVSYVCILPMYIACSGCYIVLSCINVLTHISSFVSG